MAHPQQRQRGFTLIELSIALGAMLVLAAVAVGAWGHFRDKERLTTLISTISAIDAAARTQSQGVFTYTGISITSIWAALPGDVRGSASLPQPSIAGPWGAVITLAPAAGTNGYLTRYEIAIDALPASACNGLLTALSASFQGVSTRGVSRKNASNAQMTASQITNACGSAEGDDTTQIRLVNG